MNSPWIGFFLIVILFSFVSIIFLQQRPWSHGSIALCFYSNLVTEVRPTKHLALWDYSCVSMPLTTQIDLQSLSVYFFSFHILVAVSFLQVAYLCGGLEVSHSLSVCLWILIVCCANSALPIAAKYDVQVLFKGICDGLRTRLYVIFPWLIGFIVGGSFPHVSPTQQASPCPESHRHCRQSVLWAHNNKILAICFERLL